MMAAFSDVFADVTKQGTKLQTSEYLASGKYPIIDQGQDDIAGYTDRENGLFTDVPAIIFGDHTRIVKYVDMPFFLGADGVKVLKATIPDVDCRYLYYAVSAVKIPNTGYNRHFKWLKEARIPLPDISTQRRIADTLDKVAEGIALCRKMMDELDLMVKAKFVEMFGDAKINPFGWAQNTIGEACVLKSGTSLPLEKENEGGSIPYVKVGDMNYVGNEKYITTSSRFVTEETAGVGIFPVGTVVFPKRGGAIGTNKKRLTSVPICADLNVMGVIPGKQLLPQYLLAYFDTIDLGSLNNGSSVPQINNKDIAPLLISVPPIELQEQFTTFVSKIDKSRLTIQQVLSKIELEQKVLMQKYFG